jgi:small subunit ribosomal protein S16
MAVKIRLQRKGKKKQPFYHIVIADARSPRDGRFIEKIGTYNPLTKPATIDLDRDKAFEWLAKGAQPTETVRAMLRFKGVLYRQHVMRGVKKGAFNEEVAMQKYEEYVEAKEAKTAGRAEKELKSKATIRAKIAGLDIQSAAPAKVVPKVQVAEEAPAAAQEEE